MSEGYEFQTGYAVVDAKLINDAAVIAAFGAHIYPGSAPQTVEERFVAYNFVSGIPLYVVGDSVVWLEGILDTIVVGRRDDFTIDIEAGAAAVHLALQRQRGTATNGQVLHIKWIDTFDRAYERSTGLYPSRIQRYRVTVK